MNNISVLIGLFIIIQLFVPFIPFLTRKTENFGVSIPANFYYRNDFKRMRKRYAIMMCILLLLFTACLVISHMFFTISTMYVLFAILAFVYLMTSFLVYLPFHHKMKQVKRKENWQTTKQQKMVIDTSFRQEKLTVSLWWYLIPGALIALTLLWTYLTYHQIPQQIPMHTDFAGKITYEEKSLGNLLFIPGTQLVILALFLFIHYLIKGTKQQVSVENPDVSKKQNILFRRRWSAFMVATGTLMILLFLFVQLTFIYPNFIPYEDIVIFAVITIILISTIILSITTGQGGSRIKIKQTNDANVMDRDDDEYWKLGQFYFNKEDPAVFIEKRFGIGWTNNWANPISWFFIIGIILVSLTPLLLIIFL